MISFEIPVHMPSAGDSSPWGRIDAASSIADGIVTASTPSHGGIWLSRSRFEAVDPRWGMPQPSGWFEEDCEWAIAAYTHLDEFKAWFAVHRPQHDVEASVHQTLRAWLPDAYEAITGREVLLGQSSARDLMRFAAARPEGVWMDAAYGGWHGLVPDGHVGVHVRAGNRSALAEAGGDVRGGGSPEARILITKSDYDRACEQHRWLGPAPLESYERWPETSGQLTLENPSAHLRAMTLKNASKEDAMLNLASWRPGSAAMLYAKAGQFDRVLPLLDRFDAGDAGVCDVVLWMAARVGDEAPVERLLAAGADPDWNDAIALHAAQFHKHHFVEQVLKNARAPVANRSVGLAP